jgi:alkylhydroperoxidase family enzyme
MPRIEPIPMDQLSSEARRIVDDGVAAGLYSTPIPLQIFAYKSAQLQLVDLARQHFGKGGLLAPRIVELLRIRSAQLGECEPCSASRKHESITDDDVACLVDPGHGSLDEQERMAIEFIDLLSGDHHAMDDDFYRRLGKVFTAAQIIELAFIVSQSMGLHRFIHTLDVFGESEPVIRWAPDQVDTAI